MQSLWASIRAFTTGPAAKGVAVLGTVLTLVTVVQTIRGESGWMWACFAALALAALAFSGYHQERGHRGEVEDELAETKRAQELQQQTGPRVQFGPPKRIRAILPLPEDSWNLRAQAEVLVIPVWNTPHHQEDAPALNVHIRADVTYPTGGLQGSGWIPTWLEDLPREEFEVSLAPDPPREVTLPSNGRKFYVVVMALFIGMEECREWTREGVGRPIADEFERDTNYWLRLLVNSSNGEPRQVGHEIEYQWPYVHIDGGRTFSAWP